MLKKIIAKLFASYVVSQIESTYSKAAKIQKQTLIKLIKKASKTQFGLDHKFDIGAELDLNKSLEDSDIDLSNSSAASVWED